MLGASSEYNVAALLRAERPLDTDALEHALRETIRRHETLRTVFTAVDGVPVQEVRPPHGLELPVRDLSREPDPEGTVLQVAREEANRPFDPATGPLLRMLLLRLGGGRESLLVTTHHLVCDGWSVGILFRELDAHYRAYREGRAADLPPLPIQYRDYAVWERGWLQGALLEEQLTYWRHTLRGVPAVLQLPLDRPRAPVRRIRGVAHPISLPSTLVLPLAGLAAAEGASQFVALLAGFTALLARYSGQHDIVVGVPVAGRCRSEVTDLIGLFLNTLVLRVDLSGNPGFRELLRRVREATAGAFSHQDVSFDRVVQGLKPDRDYSYTPLFQVLFNLQVGSDERLWLPGMGARLQPFDTGIVNFDVEVNLFGRSSDVEGSWNYNREVFEPVTAARMASHYQRLLEQVVAEPERGLMEVPLLDADERRHVLVEWNATRVDTPAQCLHDAFAAQAARAPASVAVVHGAERLSYGEVAARVCRVAGQLRTLGVGPEVMAGILLERSPDLVVTLLAVLEAGGVAVPLDPSAPAGVLAERWQATGGPLLVSRSELAGRLRNPGPARVLLLDRGPAPDGCPPAPRPAGGAGPENAAVVAWESDWTEGAAAAVHTHAGIWNRVRWLQDDYRLEPEEGVLAHAPVGSDAGIWELLWPLCVGARLVLAPPGGAPAPDALAALARDHAVGTLRLTPTLLGALLAEGRAEACPGLRQVLCGGEPLSRRLVARCRQSLPAVTLHNLYGTTQTGEVCRWECRGVGRERVPIGWPAANVRIHVLDEWRRPVPVGVVGELFVGGTQSARGYLGRPALTAERFLPDPWGESGDRLFRTGDLARRRHDGALELLGRASEQVRTGDVRVDRLEMEEGIAGHPGVAMSAIAAIPHGPGAHRFVAYVVPGHARAPGSAAEWSDPDQLLESVATHARRLLAGGLVPSAFAVLERLPVRANGKLDREALPAAEPTARWSAHVPPRDEMERLVADIWRSVLGREAIGVHDSFFELGGHSLLAIQVVDRLKRALGVELPVAALTRYRTLAELAARLSELGSAAREGGGPGSLVRLQSGTLPPALVLVHPAGGGVLCYGALTTWLFDRSVYAFEARDACADLPGLASRYVGELLDRGLDGAVCLGGWSLGGVVAFEIATQLVRRGARPVPVILIDSFTSECRAGEAGDPLSLVRAFLRDLSARQDTEPPPLPDDVGDRPPEAILALAHERMRAGGLPTDIELDGLLRRFDVFRGNLLALAAYRPAPYPGPVRLVQAAESPSAVEYWRRLSGDFQSFRLRGDHYGLLRASNAPLLANLLDRILDSSADSAPAAGDG